MFLNTVGTSGFSTAGHWWGRSAAMVRRATHYLFGHRLVCRLMLFTDGGKALCPLAQFRKTSPAIFALYVSLSLDVKWSKNRGGFRFQWSVFRCL